MKSNFIIQAVSVAILAFVGLTTSDPKISFGIGATAGAVAGVLACTVITDSVNKRI